MEEVMSPRGKNQTERGVALVTALLLTLMIVVMGAGLIVSSRGAQRVETGFKNQQRTFEVAVAGLERAREILRQCRFDYINSNGSSSPSCSTISNKLDIAAGADDTLVDVTSIAAFEAGGGLSVDDVPLINDTVLGDVTYRVYLTNDPWDDPPGGATVKTDGAVPDGKNVVTLTAFARGANNEGFTAAQAIFRTGTPFPFPQLPGLITLPGPDANYTLSGGGTLDIDGNFGDPPCYAAIATSSNAASGDIRDEIPNSKQDQFHTCTPGGGGNLEAHDVPGSVENFLDTATHGANPYFTTDPGEANDPQLVNPTSPELLGAINGCSGDDRDFIRRDCMEGLRSKIETLANDLTASGKGYRGTSPTDFGTPSNPKVVVDTNDLDLGPGTYGGTLLVMGNLTLHGNVNYTGLIMSIGNGNVRRNGGGSGSLCGGILVVDVNPNSQPGDNFLTASPTKLVGIPDYDHRGGGNTNQMKCELALQGELQDWALPMARIAFQQLR